MREDSDAQKEDLDVATDPVHRSRSLGSSATNDRFLQLRRATNDRCCASSDRPSKLQTEHGTSRLRHHTKESNTVVSSTDSKLSIKKVATSCFTQAVAEPIMAGLEKLQARLDEINAKLDGTKKDVSDRRCKDNTSNDPFSRCKSVQQFGCR